MLRLFFLIFLPLFPAQAWAGKLTDAEQTSLQDALVGFREMIYDGSEIDAERLLPDRLRAHIISRFGITPDLLQFFIKSEMEARLGSGQAVLVHVQTDQMTVNRFRYDGSVIIWGMSPMTIRLLQPGGKVLRSEHPALILRDGDQWYFLHVNNGLQREALMTVYPFIRQLDIHIAPPFAPDPAFVFDYADYWSRSAPKAAAQPPHR